MNRTWTQTIARSALLAAMAGAATLAQAGAGYVTLSAKGKTVLSSCNPKNLPARVKCSVAELPGEPGYTLVASNTAPVVKNEITVGTVYDQVWKNADDEYIFGARVELNAEPYDLTGLPFHLNDVFRTVLDDEAVAVAYQPEAGTVALKKAGRTLQGLKEPDPEDDDDDQRTAAARLKGQQPTRNNDWVDFRVDAAATAAGPGNSPWLLVKTRAPAGFSLQPFALRLLSSDFADPSQVVEIYVPAHQPD